jgi:hypothetical protein
LTFVQDDLRRDRKIQIMSAEKIYVRCQRCRQKYIVPKIKALCRKCQAVCQNLELEYETSLPVSIDPRDWNKSLSESDHGTSIN